MFIVFVLDVTVSEVEIMQKKILFDRLGLQFLSIWIQSDSSLICN
jgi:hypothetical protein